MATKKAKKAVKKVAVKKAEGKRPTRCEITALILCEGKRKAWTLDELVSASDKRHSELGGKANVKEAEFSTRRAVSICRAIGIIEGDNDKLKVIGKVV